MFFNFYQPLIPLIRLILLVPIVNTLIIDTLSSDCYDKYGELHYMDYQRGQILLIVVLVMVTVLTVGLSVAIRSITNTRSSQEAATSEQAFSAAEAGIEKQLASGSTTNIQGSLSLSNGNAQYSTTVVNVVGLEFPLNNGSPVLKDEPADLWFSTYPGYTNQWSGTFSLFWNQTTQPINCSAAETNTTTSALEILVFSGTKANPQVARYFYDPCSSRQTSNHFTPVNPGSYAVAGATYTYSTPTITVTNGLFARIIPLYGPAYIANRNCGCNGGLPSQGTLIQSVGTVANTERKIQTYRYYPQLPAELLQYSFFVPK